MPVRIQRKRTKGWKMPPNTVSVTRPGRWGNPFRIGGYFMVGPGMGKPGMSRCEALDAKYADAGFTKIESADQAVAMYRTYIERYPQHDVVTLRGKNLACFCALGQPCHADVLLELANAPAFPQAKEVAFV